MRVLVVGAVWLAAAGKAAAQAPAYFAALAVPPRAVGSCMPARAPDSGTRSAEALQGRRLVMTTRTPPGRRELTVYLDARGQARRLMDMVTRGTGPAASVGETVIASVASTGEVQGVLLRTSTVMELPPRGVRLDTAALRVMRERARSEQSRETLTAKQREQVGVVAAWLVGRCPG